MTQFSSDDSEISIIEWVVIILCSPIGCILGIVYLIQGKPKGLKVLIASIVVNIIGALLKVFLAPMLMHH